MVAELFQRAEFDWFPLIVVAVWLLSGILGNKKKRRPGRDEAEETPPPRQRTEHVDRKERHRMREILREIEEDLGLKDEEKQTPTFEPEPQEAEQPRTTGEAWHTPPPLTDEGEQRTRAMHRREMMPVEKHERRMARGRTREAQIVRNTLPAIPVAPSAYAMEHGRRSQMVDDLLEDLTSGGDNLSRAMLLREVLGPPAGLRDPD